MEGDSKERENMKMSEEPLLLLLDNSPNPKGGFRTLPFIIANEAFERVASTGVMPNMITYLMKEYHMEMVTGNYLLNMWSAATNFLPVIGAFLADSFLGRYTTIGFGSIFSLLGMLLLWSTTIIPQARPPACVNSSTNCISSTAFQVIFLCCSFGLMSIGAGGIRSSSLAFGVDQLSKGGKLKNTPALEGYFGWYYACTTLAILISLSCVVYIQEHLGWKIGFGVPVVLMFVSALSFLLASSFYIKLKDKTSFVTGFIQVIVASFRNRHLSLSSETTNIVYHYKSGSDLLVPSNKLRFLNKACVIRNPQQYLTADGGSSNSWNLCTVDQVEEFKAVLKVIPLWSTGMLMSINISQPSFPVLQAASMDRHVTSGFEIPAASFGIFAVISITLWMFVYNRLILPLVTLIMSKPVHFTIKQRMGAGIFLSFLSLASTATIEYVRRGIAVNEGVSGDPQAVLQMSAMWLILPNCLIGFAEALNAVAQYEFYFSEFPRSMSSIASTLQGLGMCGGNLLATLIMRSVDQISRKEGNTSWVSSNINEGHYDYYYWVLATLSMFNLMHFLVCSWAYGPTELDRLNVLEE